MTSPNIVFNPEKWINSLGDRFEELIKFYMDQGK